MPLSWSRVLSPVCYSIRVRDLVCIRPTDGAIMILHGANRGKSGISMEASHESGILTVDFNR